MTNTDYDPLDLIGVGFGPSNLALAIALQESQSPISARFLEARPQFAWHPGMMIPGADMQISFLKDLVSQRNPQSAFTFVNYLHSKGRLTRFLNRKTFFPSRTEFNDYLAWAAGQLEVCDYDQRVVGIEAVGQGSTVREIDVITQTAQGAQSRHRARNLVIAPGGRPRYPDVFAAHRNDPRLTHSNDYMKCVVGDLRPNMRIAIIGGGQSGAEIFADLADRPEASKVDLILRSRALRPSDDSPFVNEIFDPNQIDQFHGLSEAPRRAALRELMTTNYSVVDEDLIQQIYDMLYEQSVQGHDRLSVEAQMSPLDLTPSEAGMQLTLDGITGTQTRVYDHIILATGYTRLVDETMLHGINQFCTGECPGRDYRLPMTDAFLPSIFVQGYSEPTHGLSDTLLSVLALRSQEIVDAVSTRVLAQKTAHAAE